MSCGTPGCIFRDFHLGPHSTQLCLPVRKRCHPDKEQSVIILELDKPKRPKRYFVPVNRFQLGFELARDIVAESQIGVNLILSTGSLNWFKGWKDFDSHFVVKITTSNSNGRFVATAQEKDGTEITLTPDCLMLADTYVKWNPIPAKFYKDLNQILNNEEHKNASDRAAFIAKLAIEFGTCRDDYHLILDGAGNNRMVMTAAYSRLSLIERPHLITLEMNPIVAFNQRLLFGDDIWFTGAFPSFTTKDLVEGRFSHPKIEHLILKDNPLLTNSIKRRAKVLYLDYCGGPVANQTPEKCSTYMLDMVKKLPALEILGVTISRRRHANLDDEFTSYVPVPPGFCLAKTFTDNRRVVCNVYVAYGALMRVVI